MASKPQRPCKEIGCRNLTRKSYCNLHENIARNIQQDYNKYQRDPKIDAFYHSSDWRRARKLALERDNYLCQRHLKQGVLVPAKIVHHIVEVKDDWSKRLDIDNLESVCYACHNREHKTSPRG